MPAPGDDIVVPAPYTVTITGASPVLASAEISGTLVCSNWMTSLRATNVTVKSGGFVKLPPAIAAGAMSNRVHIICSDFTLESGGVIGVTGSGYLGRYRNDGDGPGGGSALPSGAGHGGNGLGTGPGLKYGSPYLPMAPGSGGGGRATGTATGGSGGGAVFIESSGQVRVDGTISANGTSASAADGGGGSGGSILIVCATFAGNSTGLLTAKGGGPGAYAGGGGRIAVLYDPGLQAAQPVASVRFSAMPGGGYLSDAMGSLCLPDQALLSEPFSAFDGVWFFGGITNWTAANMAPSNSIGFAETNFLLTVTGDVVLNGAIALGMPADSRLSCANLILTNGGCLTVYAGSVPTPQNALTTSNYGALVSVSDTLWIGSNSWVYPYSLFPPYAGMKNTNGGAVLFKATHVTIAATNAGFDATGKGHPGGAGRTVNAWGNGNGSGSGRGYGIYAGPYGGSYGGFSGGGGGAYGSSNAPVFPGSGGSAGWTGSGGAGGGVVRIQASGQVEVNGVIAANGGPQGGRQTNPQSCGGSGGSIFIAARSFRGGPHAVLSATGSRSHSTYTGGAGGRIAVAVGLGNAEIDGLLAGHTAPRATTCSGYDAYLGAISVTNGTPEAATYPTPGTAVFHVRKAIGGAVVQVQ